MEIMKKVMAIALVLAMTLSLALTASAAGSPVVGPANPGYDATTKTDTNSDFSDNIVVSKIKSASAATVLSAVGTSSSSKTAKSLTLSYAKNKNNKKVAITKVGDGKNGVFDSKKGRYITGTVKVKSSATTVTLAAYSFKGAKVSKLKLYNGKLVIKNNAFKGTKTKDLQITIAGTKKTAKDIKFGKSSFTGLNKQAKIIVSKNTMSKSEFEKLKKKLVKYGFKGSIVRK